MSEQVIFTILLGIISADFLLERVLNFLNSKSARKAIPSELEGIYDQEQYAKSQEYHRVTDQFAVFSAVFSFVLMFLAIWLGWFGLLDEWIRAFTDSELITTLVFFGVIFILSDLIGIPFSLYQNFVIEERFGFNKMTIKTFWMDKVKGYVLTILIGGGLLTLLIYLIDFMGTDFWIYFWVVATIFVLLLNVFYTSLLLPLFNKLTPIAEGELRTSIENYSQKVGFPLTNIFVMDGSKRSSKGNAFFSGLGKKKKVVLFDTLIEKHTTEELTAVFAHEVGHYKKKHIILGTIISIASMGFMLYLMSLMIFNGEVSEAMGGSVSAIHLNILAFFILYTPLSRVLSIFGNVISRKNEYEADAYAVSTYDGEPLINALKKMSSDHLSNLTPHPAYVFMNYSHPPLLQRVKAMLSKM